MIVRFEEFIKKDICVAYFTAKWCKPCQEEVDSVKIACRNNKVPLKKGGTNESSNVWVLCQRCNKKKGSTAPVGISDKNVYKVQDWL